MSWPGGIPPPPLKKITKNWKSEREEIERKRRKMKMDVGGACVIMLCNCNVLRGGQLARW